MLTVLQLSQINNSAPIQWSGLDIDSNPVYVRYSDGYLSVSVGVKGDSIFSAVYGDVVFAKQVGPRESHEFNFEELKTATAGLVVWPQQES